MLFNFDFANNTILLGFIFFSLIIDLYFLTPAVIAQMFKLIAELAIPMGIPIKEAKAEIETHPVIVGAKIRVQYNLELYKTSCAFYSSIHFGLFLQRINFLFCLYFLI